MKILFDHPSPFLLAHGGFQIQIEQTKKALEQLGVEVEWMRWWDDQQTGDIIHYFGRPGGGYIDLAHAKKMKVVIGELHTGLGSRSNKARFVQKSLTTITKKLLPTSFTAKLAWEAYQKADAFIALTTWEAHLIHQMFDASKEKTFVIPNGVEEVFFMTEQERKTIHRDDRLVSTATVAPRKRVKELSEACIVAQVPLLVVGKPYSETDSYYREFLRVVENSKGLITYAGGVSDRQALSNIYKSAKGFVLLSTMESLSLAALEAAAAECPVLLSDLPWAKSSFGSSASYAPATAGASETALFLKKFYEADSGSQPAINKPLTWLQVAESLVDVYKKL